MPSPLKQALLWGLISLFVFSLAHLGVQTADDATALASAGTLWDRHTLALPKMGWLDSRADIGQRGPDGKLYSKYGLGQTVITAMLYGIGETIFPRAKSYSWAGHKIVNSTAGAELAQYVNVFLGGLIVGLVVYEVRRSLGHQAATVAGIMSVFASPLWLAARGFGSEVGTALGILAAAVLARRALAREPVGGLWPSVFGLGFAALFRPSALAFAPAVLVWAWGRPLREWARIAGAFAAIAAVMGWYNWVRFGNPLISGYGNGSTFLLHVKGLVGYLLAPGRSVLLYAAWSLLLIPAGLRAFRQHSRAGLGLLAGLLGFYVFHALWREWEGGWAYGPRLLVPLMPAAVLLAAEYFDKLPRLTALLFLPGSLLQAAALAIDPIEVHTAVIDHPLTFDQTVWSMTHNIAVEQLVRVASPDHFIWLALWAVAAAVWLLYSLPVVRLGSGSMRGGDGSAQIGDSHV